MRNFLFSFLFVFLLAGCQTHDQVNENELSRGVSSDYIPSVEDIVDSHGDIRNLETFFTYLEKVSEKVPETIRVVKYTTEGAPIIHDLAYDGENRIISTIDSTRDEFGKGDISRAICNSIEKEEMVDRTDYSLSGCDVVEHDRLILVEWE
ncbi:DUF4362 domain-containing protein [Metabacillus sp. HB246100]|uniref:DUF4362 domain-containing protein n=1 Tax=Bacillus weihaiensis TaxID=1547283 RepID=UPI00235757E6|nr:DUF4362 domain-containing protein [Bacillus weihaiensis]